MAQAPVNELLGFSAPFAQGKEVLLPLRVMAGPVTFKGNASLLISLAKTILQVAGEPQPVARTSHSRASRHYTKLDPERRQKYARIMRSLAGGTESMVSVCRRYGVKYHAFYTWRARKLAAER